MFHKKHKWRNILFIIIIFTAICLPFKAWADSEYILYTVKPGDTLDSIAKAYNADKQEIAFFNGIDDKKPIAAGTVLKLRKQNEPEQTKSSQNLISMDIRDADIRDVLTSLSVTLKKSIIYTEEPIKISILIDNVSPEKALEMIAHSVSMTYIASGNIIMVGSQTKLHQSFYNMLPITRFSLVYISPEEVSRQVDKLDIPVQKLVLDSTQKYIWAQGTPQALSKMRELIDVLDRAENIDPREQEPVIKLQLAPMELKYIEADVLNQLISQLEIPCRTILVDVNPGTIWIDADEDALEDIKTLVGSVDIPENMVPEPEIIVEEKEYPQIEAKKLRNITASRLLPLIQGLEIPVRVFAIDSSGYSIWMRGDRESINLMNDLINRLDSSNSRDDVNYFTYKLNHLKASDAAAKLEFIGIENVRVFLLNYPQFSRDLLISCPSDRITEVNHVLEKLDVPGEKIKAVVDYSSSPSGSIRLEKRRDLIIALTGIPKESFKVSDNVTRDPATPHFVLWVEETPDNVEWIKEVIESIDNPSSNLD